ncbi:MAG: hypothetical protein ACI4II_10260 [Acutalibacteraceae bacterium]
MESVFADNADIGRSIMREIFTSFNFTINRVISANDLFLIKEYTRYSPRLRITSYLINTQLPFYLTSLQNK